LTALPPEIGALTDLTELYVNGNQLITLSPVMGRLPKLNDFYVFENPLVYPPLSVIDQGPAATLDFLRHPRAYPPYRPGAGLAWVVGTWAVVLAVGVRGVGWYVRRLGVL